jgi:hypothetical protein
VSSPKPAGDIEAVWLEWRERLCSAQTGVVGESRSGGELHGAIVGKHDDPDPESGAPVQGIDRERPGRAHDHESAQAVGCLVEAPCAAVIPDPVGDDERAPLDREPEPHTVGDAHAGG